MIFLGYQHARDVKCAPLCPSTREGGRVVVARTIGHGQVQSVVVNSSVSLSSLAYLQIGYY